MSRGVFMDNYGIFSWFGFALTMPEKMEYLKKYGFKHICFWWGDEFNELDGDYRNCAELADKYGLITDNAHIPYFTADDIWYDNISAQQVMDKHIFEVEQAYRSGIDTLVFHPFNIKKPVDGDYELFKYRINVLGEWANKCKVKIAIENLADNSTLREILDMTSDNEYIGLCFDSGHNNLAEKDDFSLIDKYANRLFAIHMHDNNSLSDQHILPFEGNVNWSSLIKSIEASGYEKSFMLESSCPNFVDDVEHYGCDLGKTITIDEYLEQASISACKAMSINK